jgi:glycine cleavage system H protein
LSQGERSGNVANVDGHELPDELYYFPETFSWAQPMGENQARVGITAFAVAQAGKVSNIRVRPAGFELVQGKVFGTMETFKWVGPLKSPVGGKIAEVNSALLQDFNIVGRSPYEDGWMILVEDIPDLESDLKNLLHGADAVKWQEDEIAKAKATSIT